MIQKQNSSKVLRLQFVVQQHTNIQQSSNYMKARVEEEKQNNNYQQFRQQTESVYQTQNNQSIMSFVKINANNQKTNMIQQSQKYNIQEYFEYFQQQVTREQIGGYTKQINQIEFWIKILMKNKNFFSEIGIKPNRCILLNGPSGCGKTNILRYIKNQFNIKVLHLNCLKLRCRKNIQIQILLGKLQNLSQQIKQITMVIFDEIDLIASNDIKYQKYKVNKQFQQNLRILSRIYLFIDKFRNKSNFIIVGCTNNIQKISNNLLKSHRFNKIIYFNYPNQSQRQQILKIICKKYLSPQIQHKINYKKISKETQGYLPRQLYQLYNLALLISIQKYKQNIRQLNFQQAFKNITINRSRHVISICPKIKWQEITGCENSITQIKKSLVCLNQNLKYSNQYPSIGFLLYGQQQKSKQLLAKCIASNLNVRYIDVNLNITDYFRAGFINNVQKIFQNAKKISPCVLTINNFDNLIKHSIYNYMDYIYDNFAYYFLKQLQNLKVYNSKNKNGIIVICLSQKPQLSQYLFKNNRQLIKLIYIQLPNKFDRIKILQNEFKDIKLQNDINFNYIGQQLTQNYTIKQLIELCNKVKKIAIRSSIFKQQKYKIIDNMIKKQHFQQYYKTNNIDIKYRIYQQKKYQKFYKKYPYVSQATKNVKKYYNSYLKWPDKQ